MKTERRRKSIKSAKYLLYRIWYGNAIVYVGRTKQPLQDRIHGHLFRKPMQRVIEYGQVSKIEYTELPTEADMNLYEIYYILKLHPTLNVDDKAKDNLTISLPELTWLPWTTHLWEKWGNEIRRTDEMEAAGKQKYRDVTDQISSLRAMHAQGLITQDEYEKKKDALREEQILLYDKYIRPKR